MFDFHEKRKIRSYVYSKPAIALVLLLTALLSSSVYSRFEVEREMARKAAEKEKELEELSQRAAVLEESVAHLKNERGIEEEIRTRFDVAKDGEQVVIIIDDEATAVQNVDSLAQPPGAQEEEGEGWFSKLRFW